MTASNDPKSSDKKAAKTVKDLLKDAGRILKEVDEAIIFTTVGVRHFPTFDRPELTFGPVLGVGGFCDVKEIRKVTLTKSGATNDQDKNETPASPDDTDEEEHYDVSTARRRIATNCLRKGDARYAVKQLHKELSGLEHARGMIDLAIEAKFLSAVSHPNIIKMRGTAECGPMNNGYFLVLDRLYGTLDDKIEYWRKEKKTKNGLIKLFCADKVALEQLLVSRLLVAYDLAAAFRYLHQHQLVYRDIKPENIGFDVRGDVKVFDFGLCKSLHPKLRSTGGMYRLTPLTGSFPFMAPEVAQGHTYNTSADVFSFGMLLWEILALKIPFKGFTRNEYYSAIVVNGFRPLVNESWPPLTRQVLEDAWSANPKERPAFNRIATLIRADLSEMSHDVTVVNRTIHMKERSTRSFHHRGSVRERRGSALRSEHNTMPSDE